MEGARGSGAGLGRQSLAWSRAGACAPLALALFVLLAAVGLARLVGYDGKDLGVPSLGLRSPALVAESGEGEAEEAAASSEERGTAPVVRIASELRARIVWALSALGLTVALLGSLVFAWGSMLLEVSPRGRASVAFAAFVVLGLSIVIWLRRTVVLPDVLQLLVNALSGTVREVRELSKGAGFAAIASMLLALCVTLAPGERSAEAVSARLSSLRRWLYVAAALLVAGLLEVAFLLHWPVARLEGVEAQAVAKLADTVTTAAGTLLSILLALTYGSAVWILRARALSLAPTEERGEWMSAQGFGSSLGQHLVRVVALLAPLVAGGPLTALLDALA